MNTATQTGESQAARRFYGGKFRRHGLSVDSLGWQSVEKQELRFGVLSEIADLEGRSVLDVGCGFGDLLGWFRNENVNVKYRGVDLMEDFVKVARERYPGGKFWAFDITGDPPPDFEPPFDYVIASGLLGLHVGDDYKFARTVLRRMFEWCRRGLAANMISTYVDYREDYLAYTQPEEIFRFCKENLTWKVGLRHDYLPYEFTLYLER